MSKSTADIPHYGLVTNSHYSFPSPCGPPRACIIPQRKPCRCHPDDPCWPSLDEWSAFNKSVSGRLIATTPIASACHTSSFDLYDSRACANLQSNWYNPATHYESMSSPMAPWFTNFSCSPFTKPNSSCTVGPLVRYAVKILTVSPAHHADLFWALNSGGGGTFAVVLSMVARLHPELETASATLEFTGSATAVHGPFWRVVETFVVDTLPLLDVGEVVVWYILRADTAPDAFTDRQRLMAEVLVLGLAVIAEPRDGNGESAYLNEAELNEPHWRSVFYGENYDKLKKVKDKYEGDGIFYGRTAVGSEEWRSRRMGGCAGCAGLGRGSGGLVGDLCAFVSL